MKEQLIAHGCKHVGNCRCNGTYNEIYQKGPHKIYIQPAYNTWKYKIGGKQKATGNHTNLQIKLDELFPVTA